MNNNNNELRKLNSYDLSDQLVNEYLLTHKEILNHLISYFSEDDIKEALIDLCIDYDILEYEYEYEEE